MEIFAQHQQLSIRGFVLSDKRDFINLLQNPLCMKYSTTGILSEQQASDYFELLIKNKKNKIYAIEERTKSTVIGCAGLQECCIEYDISASFFLRLLPAFQYHLDLHPLLQQFIDNLISLYQLPSLQAVVAQTNEFNIQLMSALNFEKLKGMNCRGIESYLYQYK